MNTREPITSYRRHYITRNQELSGLGQRRFTTTVRLRISWCHSAPSTLYVGGEILTRIRQRPRWQDCRHHRGSSWHQTANRQRPRSGQQNDTRPLCCRRQASTWTCGSHIWWGLARTLSWTCTATARCPRDRLDTRAPRSGWPAVACSARTPRPCRDPGLGRTKDSQLYRVQRTLLGP